MLQMIEQLLTRRPVVFQLVRFAGIGAMNAALDFLLLNLVTLSFGVQSGPKLAVLNIIGVCAAIIQSYLWNKYWAFAAQQMHSLVYQFIGAVLVGGLGFVTFCLAVLPSAAPLLASYGVPVAFNYTTQFYWVVLAGFLFLQLILAVNLGLFHKTAGVSAPFEMGQFAKFILVSVVGVVINSLALFAIASVLLWLMPDFSASLAKNIAKFAAVFISLVWNFAGYKFFVFKR